jgi:BlaI family transcriptional regulator, penicillinase repressor
MRKSETIDTKIPDAELELLVTLNRLGSATARELRDALAGQRPMAHGSVLTLLGRLEAKTLVAKKKGDTGKAFVYQSTARGRSATRPLLRTLVERVFGGSRVSLVATLLESQAPTAAELAEMQELIERLRRETAAKERK